MVTNTTATLRHEASNTTIHIVGTSHASNSSAQQVRETVLQCAALLPMCPTAARSKCVRQSCSALPRCPCVQQQRAASA